MGKRCVFVIYRHKGKCNSLILILLLFCFLHQKHIQDITRRLFIIVPQFVKITVWYRSVFNQYSYYCDFFLFRIASLSSPSSCVIAIFRNYKHYGFVYVIDINTHVLLFFLYYFVIPRAQFWTTFHFRVLTNCQCILNSVIIL